MKRYTLVERSIGFFSRPLVSLVSAGLLLTCLYFAADWRKVAGALAALDTRYVAAAMAMFVPLTLLSALRWKAMVRHIARITLPEAVRHTLVASSWNLLMPAKLGDLSKALMLPYDKSTQVDSIEAVVTEKVADVGMLVLLIVLGASGFGGWLLAALLVLLGATAAAKEWHVRAEFLSFSAAPRVRGLSWSGLVALSLALWALHLVQIDLMLKAAGVFVPWSTAIARVPLALFAGLVPISFCGIGTRDAALAVLFADVADASTMAAVGMLTALRYIVPGAIGIPVQAASRKRGAMRQAVDVTLAEALEVPHRSTARDTAVSSR